MNHLELRQTADILAIIIKAAANGQKITPQQVVAVYKAFIKKEAEMDDLMPLPPMKPAPLPLPETNLIKTARSPGLVRLLTKSTSELWQFAQNALPKAFKPSAKMEDTPEARQALAKVIRGKYTDYEKALGVTKQNIKTYLEPTTGVPRLVQTGEQVRSLDIPEDLYRFAFKGTQDLNYVTAVVVPKNWTVA
jgi:hypothetical protein